jgi:hypothetical protein
MALPGMTRPGFPRTTPVVVWAALGILILVLPLGLYFTSEGDISLEYTTPAALSTVNSPVDQEQYETARNLAALAATEQEKQYAVMALRAADHELDKAFASAIRNSALERQTLSGAALQISQRIDDLRQAVKKDEETIAVLGPDTAGDNSTDQADHRKLAQAQLALDNDELDSLQLELARVGGNKRDRIERAFEQHRSDRKPGCYPA